LSAFVLTANKIFTTIELKMLNGRRSTCKRREFKKTWV